MSRKLKDGLPNVQVGSNVVRQIRQHARSSSKTEVCGVLIGRESGKSVEIEACIPGVNAEQAGAHVTFTQDTWEHIYQVKDREYPEQRIVGWYHSHPGFGIFLSDHDTFIHKNFFSSPQQVAWVYDPHSDEEGCFGWVGDRIERLPQIAILDRQLAATAATGGVEPAREAQEDGWSQSEARGNGASDRSSRRRWATTIVTHLMALLLGLTLAWYVFPRILVFAVDPRTGVVIPLDPRALRVLRSLDSRPEARPAPQDAEPRPGGSSSPNTGQEEEHGQRQ